MIKFINHDRTTILKISTFKVGKSVLEEFFFAKFFGKIFKNFGGIFMNDLIEKKLKTLPENPGVYLMKNSAGKIIYVGKAKIFFEKKLRYLPVG